MAKVLEKTTRNVAKYAVIQIAIYFVNEQLILHDDWYLLQPIPGWFELSQEKYVMDADKLLNNLPTDFASDGFPVPGDQPPWAFSLKSWAILILNEIDILVCIALIFVSWYYIQLDTQYTTLYDNIYIYILIYIIIYYIFLFILIYACWYPLTSNSKCLKTFYCLVLFF